jgi:glucose-6-phosphate isomerase
MAAESVVERIWRKDPAVWGATSSTRELTNRFGWLDVTERLAETPSELHTFADRVREECDVVVLCGMGGSSLAPEVFSRVFGAGLGYPRLTMLDSTAPDAVRGAVEGASEPLFVIASKSGSTLETTSFLSYFWRFAGANPSRFVAITDPGSSLARLASEKGFRRIFEGDPDVGGRFSALSPFGLVPAALIGVDLDAILENARSAMDQCRGAASPDNPGAWLGAVIGEAAVAGRDKLTISVSPALAGFGMWAEQLIAESTGKGGVGVLPVIEGTLGTVESYGRDRVFVSLQVDGDENTAVDQQLDQLAEAGHPVVRLSTPSRDHLGGEFFRWEFATAVAAAVLGVNAFDQPNVAESKANTQEVLDAGAVLPPLRSLDSRDFRGFAEAVQPGDYVAILAYVAPSGDADRLLENVARALQDRLQVAVTTGYGPRYLHSTGQLHKGGPKRGHFIQIVESPGEDVAIPGAGCGFGQLLRAQAEGDARALAQRGRPLLRLPTLAALSALVERR